MALVEVLFDLGLILIGCFIGAASHVTFNRLKGNVKGRFFGKPKTPA